MKAVMVHKILMFSNPDQHHSPDVDLNPNATRVRMKAILQLQHTLPFDTLGLAAKQPAWILVATGGCCKIQVLPRKRKTIKPCQGKLLCLTSSDTHSTKFQANSAASPGTAAQTYAQAEYFNTGSVRLSHPFLSHPFLV